MPVPNAPCGVESRAVRERSKWKYDVPNAPCGVERNLKQLSKSLLLVFLMHRVELKGRNGSGRSFNILRVPNAPCGVESHRQRA